MAIGDKFKMHVLWRNNALNLTAENGFAFTQTSAAVFSPDAADLVQRFINECLGAYCNMVSNIWFIEGYRVVELPSNLTVYELGVTGQGGNLTGDPLPPQTTMVLSVRTAGTGRSARGRVFVPPANEAANTSEGLIAQSHLDLGLVFQDRMLDMVDVSASYAEWEWGLWSEKQQTITPVTNVVPRNKWATQRGRTR